MTNNNNTDIMQELKILAPNLAKISKRHHQTVPDGYFIVVEEEIMRQINILCSVDNINKDVPKDYFNSLEDRIIYKIGVSESKKPIDSQLIQSGLYIKFRYALAAILVFALAMVTLYNIQVHTNYNADMAVSDQEAYFNYLQKNVDDIDLNDLIEQDLLTEQDLTFISTEAHDTPENTFLIPESEITF
jgi:hypothetical protein